jgi:hypothetical protein
MGNNTSLETKINTEKISDFNVNDIPKQMRGNLALHLYLEDSRKELLEHDSLKLMINDFNEYGSFQSGIYKGIWWEMKKPYKTYWTTSIRFIDGDLGITLTDEEYEELLNLSHGPMINEIGFECNQCYDFPTFISDETVYRDYAYVRKTIIDMIDFITK